VTRRHRSTCTRATSRPARAALTLVNGRLRERDRFGSCRVAAHRQQPDLGARLRIGVGVGPIGLFKAYVLREELDHLWTYKTRDGVANFLWGWLDVAVAAALGNGEARRHVGQALRWHRRLMRSCGPLWVVESLNTTIKGVIRRGRGVKDDTMLLLKLKWATT